MNDIIKIQKSLNLTVPALSDTIKKHKDHFNKVLQDPTELTTKIASAIINKQTYKSVAEELNLLPSYVQCVAKMISENPEFLKKSKSFESFLCTISGLDYKSFIDEKPTKNKFVIKIWFDYDKMPEWIEEDSVKLIYSDFSKHFSVEGDLTLDVYDDQWKCRLRTITGNKHHYVEAKASEDKDVMLQFIVMCLKFL